MTQTSRIAAGIDNRITRWVYGLTLFFLALSGFGQMPIYKRYKLADIPGLTWLADFYATHYLHYVSAIVFLGLIAYILTRYRLNFKKSYFITPSGYVRGVWITGIIFTGTCLVVNNFRGVWFSPGFIIFLDLAHIGFVMLFFITALYCKIKEKKWIMEKKEAAT